ncbi:MAG: hypothetical protein ABMB14_27915 [Myxococcota bacterium]
MVTLFLSTVVPDLRRVVVGALLLVAAPAVAQDAPAPAGGSEPTAAPEAPAPAPAPEDPAPADPGATPAEPAAEPAPASPPPGPAPITRLSAPLPPPPPVEDDLPIPTLTIDRVPPNTSYEFAIQVSYGMVAYFRDSVPPWVGFGARAGWGKNFGPNRLGVTGTFAAEGDFGVHTQLSLEPQAAWDLVTSRGLLLGASVGPAVVYTASTSTVETVQGIELAPMVAARIGWSQTWSRVGRRLFVFLEPKARFAAGQVSPVVALAVGSGAGR